MLEKNPYHVQSQMRLPNLTPQKPMTLNDNDSVVSGSEDLKLPQINNGIGAHKQSVVSSHNFVKKEELKLPEIDD